MRTSALLLALAMAANLAHADITGAWRTIDDKSNEPKSVIQIEQRGSEYVGTVRDILAGDDGKVCDKCEGELKGKPIVGLQILTGLKANGEKYEGGKVVDPETGKVYRATLWLEDENTLKVRGYLGPFFRTQTWERAQP